MPENEGLGRDVYLARRSAKREDANKAPLSTLDNVEALIKKYRGNPAEIRAGIQAAVLAALATASALSMIPFESNFASVFAGRLMGDLISPGVSVAINGPTRDYLENIFPTSELSVRLLVTGIENGALTDEEVIDTGVDGGVKDKEIRKLLKIAKMARFTKETREDYAMVDRYQDAMISAQITNARDEIDAAIADRKALIAEYKKLAEKQAMEVTPT